MVLAVSAAHCDGGATRRAGPLCTSAAVLVQGTHLLLARNDSDDINVAWRRHAFDRVLFAVIATLDKTRSPATADALRDMPWQ